MSRTTTIVLGLTLVLSLTAFVTPPTISAQTSIVSPSEQQPGEETSPTVDLSDLNPPEAGETIASVNVQGNVLIDADTILFRLNSQPGDSFDPTAVRGDIKALYATGFFQDVKVDLTEVEDGLALTFIVEEKPRVLSIVFTGHNALSANKLEEAITVEEEDIWSPSDVQESVVKIKEAYLEQGFNYVDVTPIKRTTGQKEIELEFAIDEGRQLRIGSVEFEGNDSFSDRRLRRVLDETREHWFLSWATGGGKFNPDLFQQDMQKLEEFYLDRGYAEVAIGQPERRVEDKEKGKWFSKGVKRLRVIHLTIPVQEGAQYRVGEVRLQGNEVLEDEAIRDLFARAQREQLLGGLLFGTGPHLQSGDVYSQAVIRDAMQLLSEEYGKEGYIYVDPRPQQTVNKDEKTVDIQFDINEGVQASLKRLEFSGHTRTRDNVMRREVKLAEGDVFDTSELRRSLAQLTYLGYLQDVQPDVRPQEDPSDVELEISVKDERRTELQLGGGYSSVDGFFGQVSISEHNLFGKGQEIQISAQTGLERSVYRLRFADPYILGTENFFSLDLFRTDQQFPDFDRVSTGGTVFTGRPLSEYMDYRIGYTYERIQLERLSSTAEPAVVAAARRTRSSSITQFLVYDSRNNQFDPTDGARHRLSAEYAGGLLGGDNQFYKYIFDSSTYMPLSRQLTFLFHTQVQYGGAYLGGELPVFERFTMGGEQSVRGFARRSIGPLREDGTVGTGNKTLLFNLELIMPLAGPLKGVLFFDAGDNYADKERMDIRSLRTSAGVELRFFVPTFSVPFRFIWGYNLDPWVGEEQSQFQFTIGTGF